MLRCLDKLLSIAKDGREFLAKDTGVSEKQKKIHNMPREFLQKMYRFHSVC